MHNKIYEISRHPIRSDQRARAGHMPEWFYERVCDYAKNPSPTGRESAIQALSNLLGSFCIREGDKFSLSPQIKASFFRRSYDCFKAAAKTLAQTDYGVFAGLSPSSTFLLTLDTLNDSYEDPHGIYIYCPEAGTLVTLEHWLRSADLSHPFYIGGIIEYYVHGS